MGQFGVVSNCNSSRERDQCQKQGTEPKPKITVRSHERSLCSQACGPGTARITAVGAMLRCAATAGESCDDRTHDAVRWTRPVRAAVDAIWPKVDPVRLVFGLLSDPATLQAAAGGILDEAEQSALGWEKPPRGPGAARWSPADVVLIDEARDLIQRTASLSHVVVDEAQDLSPMECRAIGR